MGTQWLCYDPQNRLLSTSQIGGYTYGDPAHVDVARGAGSNGSGGPYYNASHDAAGDMTCRAPNRLTVCSATTATGQPVQYDNERRLVGWQSAPGSNPATTITDAYDADGQRVAQQVTSGGTTTTTDYIAKGLEEQTGSTLIKYESVPGVITAEVTGSGSSESVAYLAADGLGSVSEALDGSGNVLGAQLYGPFGGVRYSSGTMPTARGYTGQYADAASGLDYYNARYYDPALGQFTSADTKQGPNRYAYVAGNPETLTDPTGQRACTMDDCGIGGGGGSGSGNLGNSDGGLPPVLPPPPPMWTDYGPWIAAHRFDVLNTPSDIYDQRGFHERFLGSSDDQRTYNDGVVLMNYFDLSVILRNTHQGANGRISDYLVGIVRLGAGPVFPYTEGYMEAGTPMDLYTPETSKTDKIVAKAQSKWNQAPIIVMDISSNSTLKGYSTTQLEDEIGSKVVTNRGGQGPYRVIFIKDGAIYDDYNPNSWGPSPFNPNAA